MAILTAAYIRLSTTRAMGMGCVGPIPCDKIEDWCARRGIIGAAAEFAELVISLVDQDTMKRQAEPKSTPGDRRRPGK